MEPEEVNMSLNAFLNELVKMNIDDVKNLLIRIKLFRRECGRMREIKFKGKSVDDGKWYYGLPYFSKDRTKCQIRYDISERGCTFVDVIPETISEFISKKIRTLLKYTRMIL